MLPCRQWGNTLHVSREKPLWMSRCSTWRTTSPIGELDTGHDSWSKWENLRSLLPIFCLKCAEKTDKTLFFKRWRFCPWDMFRHMAYISNEEFHAQQSLPTGYRSWMFICGYHDWNLHGCCSPATTTNLQYSLKPLWHPKDPKVGEKHCFVSAYYLPWGIAMTRLFGIFSSGNQNFRSLANHCISECDGIPQPIHCEGSIVPTSPNPYFQTKNKLHVVVTTTTRLVQYTIHSYSSIHSGVAVIYLPMFEASCLQSHGHPNQASRRVRGFLYSWSWRSHSRTNYASATSTGTDNTTCEPRLSHRGAPRRVLHHQHHQHHHHFLHLIFMCIFTMFINYCITFINSTWYLQ